MGFDYDVPMLDAQFVNLDQGTGIVHCAQSHGPMILTYLNKNNKSLYTVDVEFMQRNSYFTNTHIFKADPIVIEKLKEQINYLRMISLTIVALIHGDLRRL